jgi:hypothetical protein
MNPRLFLYFFMLLLLFEFCAAGKVAYKRGDYYSAVMEAVERLRSSPNNKKSKDVLTLSYQPAVDYLNTDAQNQLASNATLKWKTVVQDYQKINTLYENIRTSPGALKVVPGPVNKYKELTQAKDSAAAECYAIAVLEMLKNTREDAKQAFFLFTDVNNFSPGYRESIEMMQQAKSNATLNVVVEPSYQSNSNWTFDQVIFKTPINQFVEFYTPQSAKDLKLQRIDQRLRLTVNDYQESRPFFRRATQTYQDSVANGERIINGQKRTTYQQISAQMVLIDKQISASASLQLYIQDASSKAELTNSTISSQFNWDDRWAFCTGDTRAVPREFADYCNRSESYPAEGFIMGQTKKDMDAKLANALGNFYRSY